MNRQVKIPHQPHQRQQWRNWGRTVSVRPERIEAPATVPDLQRAVAAAAAAGQRVKAVGAGHSFTGIAEAPGLLLDLARLQGLLGVDTARGQVRLLAGTRLHRIPGLLAPYGLAMPNLGDIDRQSIAGAISTGTHGTGAAFGGLATQVAGLTLVQPDGGLLTLEAGDPLLPAAALSLGALGIIAEVTLQCVPAFVLRAEERQLADCEACTQEVRELSATAARLGLAVAETPPREMRDRVLREITTVRQEAPAHGRPERTGGSGRTGRWYAYALAACVAAAAAFGGVAVWQNQVAQDARQEADRAQRQSEELAQVISAPDAKTSSGELTGGAHGTVVVSQSRNRAVFLASGMERPPSGKVYQLWFNDAGTMRSAGLMDPKASDDAVLLDGPVDRASGMGITVEPAGGSAEPTSSPVALMDFPTA